MNIPTCIKCHSEYTYHDGSLIICPECAYEWKESEQNIDESEQSNITDAHGQILQDGDFVTIIKDLKIKGSSSVVKVGTKVKVRLVHQATDGHNLDCKITGIGAMKLKSEFVKKA